jgi:cobalt-zinc-cadmium resistance protein CzcA
LLSLGAIDYGTIVNGAVVMVEYAFAKLCSAPATATRAEKKELVLTCAKEVATPILFSIAIIATDFSGVANLGGVAGKLFRPMVYTMGFHLIGALVSALLVIPTLIGIILTRRKLSHKESPIVRLAQLIYKPISGWSLRNRIVVILGVLVSLGIATFLAPGVGSEFLPALDEGVTLHDSATLFCNIIPTLHDICTASVCMVSDEQKWLDFGYFFDRAGESNSRLVLAAWTFLDAILRHCILSI